MYRFQFALTLVLLAGACAQPPPSGPEYDGTVVKIVDGDTLYLDGVDAQIRLFGVDAPERDETGFKASKDFLTSIASNRFLTCRAIERDRYGRIVAQCFLDDGREINRLMLDEPHTDEYCRYSRGFYGRCG